MLAIVIATVLLVAQAPTPQPRLFNVPIPEPTLKRHPVVQCRGIDPQLASISVRVVGPNGKYDRYLASAIVADAGLTSEPPDFPQHVDIFRDGRHVATVPVAPMYAGQTRTVSATVDVPQSQRHPLFNFVLGDDVSHIPPAKRCVKQHDRLEMHF